MKSYQFYTKLVFSVMVFLASFATSTDLLAQCNNVTFGGTVCCNQASNVPFDPQPIVETAAPAGGTGAFEYQWLYTNNPYNTNYSQWNMVPGGTNKDYDPGFVSATTFYVRCVRRAGCTDMKESNIVVVTVSPCDNITDGGKILSNQIGCNAGQGADPAPFTNSISPSGGTGVGPIEYAWFKSTVSGIFDINNTNWTQITGANAASYDAPPGLTQTTYYVRVARRNGCITWLASNIVSVTMKMAPMVTSTTKAVTCFGGSNGSATLNVTGGTAPYSYTWDYGSIPNVSNPTNLPAGTYGVTVTDAFTCMSMVTVVVGSPAPLAVTFNPVTNVKCYNDNTGSAVVQVTGGTPTYGYLWSNGATAPQNVGLSAGKYFVTVTDTKGCQKVASVDITQPTALTASTTQTNIKCFGAAGGTATVTAAGGTAPYSYFWSNGQTSATATGLSVGVYSVAVKDANNCTVTISVNITQPTVLDVAPTKVDVACNGAATGSITLAVTGGTAPYTYAWSNGASSQNLTNVAAGTYTVKVTDANGCSKTSVITINQPTAIVVVINSTNLKCNGDKSGSAAAVVTGGTAPYTLAWSNAATTASLTGLAAGSYTLTVTDNKGCTKVGNVTITEPTKLVATPTGSALDCGGGNNGTASVVASGGTAPYKYKWSNGATAAALTNLTAGNYTVTITDGNGCTATATAAVTQPAPLDLTSVADNPKCNNGKDGSAEITVAGGTAPYTYLWSNGATTAKVTGLVAGTYTVTVTDSKNCQKFVDVVLSNPPAIVVNETITNIKCNGDKSGSISLAITGGTPAYTVAWDKGQTGTTISNLAAGTYTATVTDSKGCTYVEAFEVKQPAALVLTTTSKSVKCNGESNGGASIQINGGTAPYSILWSTGATVSSIGNIIAGSYGVTVTDANGCKEKATIQVSEPTKLDVTIAANDEKCFGSKDGSATAVASGGTAPYSYKWSNGATQSGITALVPGTYTVTILDKNACSTVGTVTIKAATLINVTPKVTDVACFGDKSGAVSLLVTGGAAPYSYSWSNGATSADITGLNAGVYSGTVTDANGCTRVAQVTIKQPNSPLTVVTATTAASCNGTNGSATATPAGGTTPYSYKWSNGGSTATISAIAAGNYTVTVTDANNCTVVASTKVLQPYPLFLATTQTNLKCNGDKNGAATVTATGGTAPYKYAWSNGAASSFINGLTAGTYTATVTDAQGCKEVISVTITQPDAIVVSASGTNTVCNGSNEGTVTATVTSGGTAPYTYKWSNGVAGQSQTGLTAGTYVVTATDQNGCTGVGTAVVGQPTLVTITGTPTSPKCKGGNDGSASVTAAGGSGTYTYVWSTGATTSSITGVGADTYYVTVTDASGCTASTTVKVEEPFSYTVQAYSNSVNCFGDKTGIAKVIVTGGPAGGAYAVLWSTGATTGTIGGLGVGVYTVSVTDTKGCLEIANAVITGPTELLIVTASTNAKCNGQANGTASVTSVSGGSTGTGSGYTYVWSTFATTPSISGLTAGIYSVTVKDGNGCTKSASFTIKEPTPVVCSAQVTAEVQTYNGTEGAAVATASGGTAPYTYKWSNGANTAAVTGLKAGAYTVTVTDANGCSCSSNISLMNLSKIGDYVWFDKNGDGIQTPGETGLPNVTITLTGTKTNGTPVSSTYITDASGAYSFDGLMPGNYKLTFKSPNEYMPTLADATFDDKDSDVDMVSMMTTTYTLGAGEYNNTIDAGYFKKVKIGDTVWFDKNKNGIQDAGEPGFANIVVKLFKAGPDNQFGTADDVLVESTATDNNGMYMFLVMPGMKYQVEFVKSSIPAGYEITQQNAGADDVDSDANPNTGRSDIIMVMFGQNDDFTIDAGLFVPCDNVIDGGLVGPKSQILCGPGVAGTINNLALPTGGNANSPIEYVWLKSTVGPNYVPGSTNWTPIPGTNSPSYAPGFLTQTTWFIRCSRRKGCDAYPAESNIVVVYVNPAPTAKIATYPTTDICTLVMNTFTATNAGAGSTYQWNFGQGSVPQNGQGLSVANVMYNSPGQKTVTLNVTKDGCDASTSVTVNVIICPGASSKVAITSINATAVQNQRVDVSWETADPTLDNVFVVERSKDGVKWESVGNLDAKNFNVLPYTFVDKKPSIGVNQYRVKHVDILGEAVMSKVRNAMILADLYKEVAIYPNPFTNKVNVELTKVSAKGATVEVVNAFGQVVKTVKIPGGQSRQEVDMSDLQSGFYVIKIDFDGVKTEVHKVMRQDQ
jgi:SdrD B-like domain/SprB repeat/Secretion system C-terminal sorting domain